MVKLDSTIGVVHWDVPQVTDAAQLAVEGHSRRLASLSCRERSQGLDWPYGNRLTPLDVWRASLPTLRAQSLATSVILQRLAETPVLAVPAPQSAAVDVVLAAPSKEWAQDVERRLRDALPKADVRLGQPSERLPDAPPPSGFTVRCEVVVLPKTAHGEVRDAVLRAFRSMGGLEIDYSEPIDLIVVAPGLDA